MCRFAANGRRVPATLPGWVDMDELESAVGRIKAARAAERAAGQGGGGAEGGGD